MGDMAKKLATRRKSGPAPSPNSHTETFSIKLSKAAMAAVIAAAEDAGIAPRVWARAKVLRGLRVSQPS